MTDRPTPETDASIRWIEYCSEDLEMADPDTCRRLERERDEARAEVQRIQRWATVNGVSDLERQLAEARDGILRNGRFVTITAEQFEALREQRETLAEACRWAQSQLGKHTRPSPIDKALAAVEGGEHE